MGEEVVKTGALIRMDDGRLPKRVVFGTIKDGIKKGNTQPKMPRAGPKYSPKEGGGL